MTITIQVDDKGTVTTPPSGGDNGASGATAAAYGNDGGAPKLGNAAGTDNVVAPSHITDIGGPPQWLSDAIGGNSETASAMPSSPQNAGEDGGEAPSF